MTLPSGHLGGWTAFAASVAAEAAAKEEDRETPEARERRILMEQVREVKVLVNQEFQPRVAHALLVQLDSTDALRAMVDRAWCRELLDHLRSDIERMRLGRQVQAGEAA